MKILYVDDEILYLKSLELIFRKNHDFHTASSEKEGIEKITKGGFEIVITDGNLIGAYGHNVEEDYQGGVNIATAANKKGNYVIGLSSEPERFKKLADGNINVIYKKPADLIILKYIIENKPTQEQLKKYILKNEVSSKLGCLENGSDKLTLEQQKEWMNKYNEIEQSLDYMN